MTKTNEEALKDFIDYRDQLKAMIEQKNATIETQRERIALFQEDADNKNNLINQMQQKIKNLTEEIDYIKDNNGSIQQELFSFCMDKHTDIDEMINRIRYIGNKIIGIL